MSNTFKDYILQPNDQLMGLTQLVNGFDQNGQACEINVVEEQPLTIFLNGQEIVTAMTIGDYPQYLALGFLKNQGMLTDNENILGIDYDDELQTVVVRTDGKTIYEEKLKKKTRTSGCAVGTVFGDMMEGLENLKLPNAEFKVSWLYELSNIINQTPSLYLKAGAIHGTVLCCKNKPLVYMEDVGRHNALDKLLGALAKKEQAKDKEPGFVLVTSRASYEMVAKATSANIPLLAAVSAPTSLAIELAEKSGLTLVGFTRTGRHVVYANGQRIH